MELLVPVEVVHRVELVVPVGLLGHLGLVDSEATVDYMKLVGPM